MLHKLLAEFEYEPNDIGENDKGYFRFEVRPLVSNIGLSLEITLNVPLQNGIFTSAETVVANQAELYQSQFTLLEASLKSYKLDKEVGDFRINEEIKKIILTPQGLNKLCNIEGKPRGFILGTLNIYRELKACHCGNEIETNNELKLINENNSILFRLTQESENYVICNKRGIDSVSAKSRNFHREFFANELKNALISLIARKLEVTKDQIALNCQNIADVFLIKFKKPDYEKLMGMTPIKASHLRLSAPASNTLILERAVEAINIDYTTAKKTLDDNIFNLHKKPLYVDKEPLTNTVKETFKGLNDLDAVCDLYDYITAPERKEFVNIHKNPIYDSIFRKPNTTSWQELVHEICEHAFSLLMKKVRLEGITVGNLINDESSHTQIDSDDIRTLNLYKQRRVFAEPRANSSFLRLFRTNTVKAIEKLFKNSENPSRRRVLEPM